MGMLKMAEVATFQMSGVATFQMSEVATFQMSEHNDRGASVAKKTD